MTKTRDLANLVSGSNLLADGVIDYSEITNTPAPFDPATLAAVAVSGSFTDLSNQPTPFDPATLAAVATTGAYGSLSGTPAAALPLTGGTLSGTLSTPALNIGGTEVISNARALTNVASIDATTKASIEAAGVGGIWVDLGTTTTGSVVSYNEITFSATYRHYKIIIQHILPTQSADMLFQFTNSSTAPITGQEYGHYWYGWNPNMLTNFSYPMEFAPNIEVAGGPSGLDNGFTQGVIEVSNPWETDARSFCRYDLPASYNGTSPRSRSGVIFLRDKKRTNSMRLFFNQGGVGDVNTAAGAIYTVYGLKA